MDDGKRPARGKGKVGARDNRIEKVVSASFLPCSRRTIERCRTIVSATAAILSYYGTPWFSGTNPKASCS